MAREAEAETVGKMKRKRPRKRSISVEVEEDVESILENVYSDSESSCIVAAKKRSS